MLIARFCQDQRASVIPTFVLGVTAIVGFVGAAIDYSRANSIRAALQSALDTTALMMSRDTDGLTQDQLTQKANDYFKAQFNRPDANNVEVTAVRESPQQGTFVLHVTANASMNTTVARVIGASQLSVGTSADIAWGIKKLELALVLDNTGSMGNNGKLAALKTASHNLLNTLQNAGKKPGDVKVAIIPFDRMVNIGTGFKDEFWVDYTVKDINKDKWNGCVIDRDQSNDVQDTTPVSTNYHTFFPAEKCGSLVQAMPLSTDWTALHAKVDQMAASGNTNTTIGLVWGWHALTPNLPFTNAAEPAPDLDKVIVMLTDGDNTQNRWSTSDSSIDARMSAACANAKAANIKIYTVRVIDGNGTLLKNCATKPNMYYNVAQADQLNGVFTSIAQNLANLRIAR